MGFKNIDVIDMDTIDLSNLNRQFLFRSAYDCLSSYIVVMVTGPKILDDLRQRLQQNLLTIVFLE